MASQQQEQEASQTFYANQNVVLIGVDSIFLSNLPRWVKVWVSWMVVTYVMCLLFITDIIGFGMLIALFDIAVNNGLLLVQYKGVVKLMGLPHLVPFGCWIAIAISRLTSDRLGAQLQLSSSNSWEQFKAYWAIIALCTVSICLTFDIIDQFLWFVVGKREVIRGPRAVSPLNK
jgi:hypothetical protein